MSGYPHQPPGYGYGYGAPPPPASQPYGSAPYGAPPPQGYATPYGAPPPPQPHGQSPYAPPAQPYGGGPSAPPYDQKPPKEKPPKDQSYSASAGYPHKDQSYSASAGYPHKDQSYSASAGYPHTDQSYSASAGYPHKDQSYSASAGYPPSASNYSPFATLVPSNFPPGTDPNVVACFRIADQDGSGLIDDQELQRALSSYNQSFSLRTVHLLMYLFTNSNARKIGPKEFTSLFYSLQSWRDIFERFDRDRSGKIDPSELREALMSLGFSVSPVVLDLLVSKFDKTGGRSKAIEYDNFIECCLTVKGLTEKFKEKDKTYTGSATFSYEDFMLTVLPFLVA